MLMLKPLQAEGQDASGLQPQQEPAQLRQPEDPGGAEGATRGLRHQLQRTNETQVKDGCCRMGHP